MADGSLALARGGWQQQARGMVQGQIGVPLLVLTLLAMMTLPIPAMLLDVLFSFNTALSLVVLLVAVYAMRPLDFAVFPTILLITTLLRLALNIASTRVVLLHGHTGPDAAGKVIEAFGSVVIGSNYVVGGGVPDPDHHQLRCGDQGRRAHLRGECALHPGCDARQADGDRCRSQCRADHPGRGEAAPRGGVTGGGLLPPQTRPADRARDTDRPR